MIYLIATLSLIFFFISFKKFKLSLGLILFSPFLYLIKTDLFFIKNILELLILICFVSFIVKIFKKEILLSKLYFLKKYTWPFVFLFTSLIIGILVSPDKIRSLGVFKAWFLLPIIFGVMVFMTIKNKKDFLQLIYFFIASCFLISLYGIWQLLLGHALYDGRVASVFASANYLAMFLGLGIAFVFLVNTSKNKIQKSLLRFIFIIIFIAFILTRSEAAFIAILAAILFAFLLRFKKIPPNLIMFLIILSLAAQLFLPVLFYEKTKNTERNQISSRFQIWYVSGKILEQNYLKGVGLGYFEAVYQKNVPYYFFPPLEWLVPEPHSLALAFLLQTGILGFFSFLFILKKILKSIQEYFLKRDNSAIFGVLIAILFVIFHGFFDTPYWKNDLSLIFWFLIFGAEAVFFAVKKQPE